MKKSIRYNTTVVAVAIALIAISTAVLSYFSYVQWGVGKENLVDTNLAQSNMKLASQCVDRIEQKIIANDGILSDTVDVDDPKTWPAAIEQVKKGDFNVDHVFIFRLDNKNPVYPPYSKGIAVSWDKVCRSFRELNQSALVLNQTNHLHKERPDNYFFASYVLKADRRGVEYLVFFELNKDKTLALADRFLRDLQGSGFYVSIVDYDNTPV